MDSDHRNVTINSEDVQNIKDAIVIIKEWDCSELNKGHHPLSVFTLQSLIKQYEDD